MMAKKVGGLALVLLGGLIAAHGGAAGQTWEILSGLLLVVIGAALMITKVVRRNSPHIDQISR
jgi:hypothetical protein